MKYTSKTVKAEADDGTIRISVTLTPNEQPEPDPTPDPTPEPDPDPEPDPTPTPPHVPDMPQITVPVPPTSRTIRDINSLLRKAQRERSWEDVWIYARQHEEAYGSSAGVPERTERFQEWRPHDPLRLEDAKEIMLDYAESVINRPRFLEGTPQPLYHVSPTAQIALTAKHYTGSDRETILKAATMAADYLLWGQEQTRFGCFPVWRGDGWKGDGPRSGGGIQYDNGYCLAAMVEVYSATEEQKYLDSIVNAADWATEQWEVSNWNYNAFSCWALCRTYDLTGAWQYLDAARDKFRYGIFPGQISDHRHRYCGRWYDPHNAEAVYQAIILRGVAALARVIPKSDELWPWVYWCLHRGWLRGEDYVEKGLPNVESSTDAICAFREDESLFKLMDSYNHEAFEAVLAYLSRGASRGRMPVSPGSFARLMEHLK